MEPTLPSIPTLASKIQRGFTLVEMMVVLAIISIVTTIALVGQGDFNRSILITDTAYTIALSLREMQSLGLSSRTFSTVQNAGYGIHMASANPSAYTLFADTVDADPGNRNDYSTYCLFGIAGTPEAKPGDCVYTAGSDGLVRSYAFTRGFTVSQFCGMSGVSRRCSTDTSPALTELSVSFVRSTSEPAILARRNGTWIPLTSAEIYLRSADGLGTRGICVSRVGQIAVTNGTCP